jgi:hypothetical protein
MSRKIVHGVMDTEGNGRKISATTGKNFLAVSGENLATKTPSKLSWGSNSQIEPYLGIKGLDIVEDNHEAGNMAVI